LVAIGYAIYLERRAQQRRDVAHAALVALKPSIQGANKEQVIAAINDCWKSFKSESSGQGEGAPTQRILEDAKAAVSILSPPATTRSVVTLAISASTSSTIMPIEKPCAA
jgi:hypothetical protein